VARLGEIIVDALSSNIGRALVSPSWRTRVARLGETIVDALSSNIGRVLLSPSWRTRVARLGGIGVHVCYRIVHYILVQSIGHIAVSKKRVSRSVVVTKSQSVCSAEYAEYASPNQPVLA